jgi:tetratricopeptide (TPR) repeat protein
LGRAETFLDFKARFIRERELAALHVAALGYHPPSDPSPDWITLGFAYELCGAARRARSPGDSETLARLAIAVAERLDAPNRPVVRKLIAARAWTELAKAHLACGRHAEALVALDQAGDIIGAEPVLAFDEAAVSFCRATTLSRMNRQAEALTLLDEARVVFEKLHDGGQVAECELLQGDIWDGCGDRAAAERSYREAVRLAVGAADIDAAGRAWLKLAVLAAQDGRVAEAMESLAQARALFRDLEAHDEVARCDWSIGVAMLAAGKIEEAIPLLCRAREAFRDLQMIEDRTLASVDLVEAFLALDRAAAARAVLGEVISEYCSGTDEPHERGLVALTYLRDLGTPPRSTAAHVRAYLALLRCEPRRLFLLPDGG